MLSTITDIGLKKKTNFTDVKQIKLTNWLVFLSINVSLLYAAINFYFSVDNAVVIEVVAILIYALLLVLAHFNYFKIARFCFIIFLYLHIMARSFCYGEASQIHLLLIPIATIALILYNLKERLVIFSLMTLGILSFALLYVFHFHTSFSIELPNTLLKVIRSTSYLTAICTQGFVMYDIIYNYEKSEKSLDKSNVLLQEQLKSIFENSLNALFLADTENKKIIKVNKRAIELFEAETEIELISNYGLDLHAVKLSETEVQNIRDVLASTGKYEDEVLYKTFKQNTFWGKLTIALIKIDGKIYHSISITDATKEKQSNQEIKNALHEKKILLAEIHHRVKNNMAVISGLLGLQANFVEDEKAKAMFQESCNRIHAMALIHDKLYTNESLARINFENYINDLVSKITASYNDSTTKIKFSIDCHSVFIDIKYAVPCGLILNELLSNIYKHAFNGRNEGQFKIECKENNGVFSLMVCDDGNGFDYEAALNKSVSLGLTLITSLADQLNAQLEVTNTKGTCYKLCFKE